MLDKLHLADWNLSKAFTMSCQSPIGTFYSKRHPSAVLDGNASGGFGKCVDNPPDVLHTYMSLCGLSMMGAPGLRQVNCALGMTQRAADSFAQPLRTAREALGLTLD